MYIRVAGIHFVKTGTIPGNKGLECQEVVTFDMTCAMLCVRLKDAGAHLNLDDVITQIGNTWDEPLDTNYNTIACAAALVSSRSALAGSRVVKTDLLYDHRNCQ